MILKIIKENKLLENIDKKLENLFADYKNISKNVIFSNFLKIKQVAFHQSSRNIMKLIMRIAFKYQNLNFLEKFLKLQAPFPERIFNSKLILVTGPSGSGKTTIAAKIASTIVDKFGRNNIVCRALQK